MENGAWLWRMTSLTTRNKVDVDKMRSKKVRFHGFNYLKMLSASLVAEVASAFEGALPALAPILGLEKCPWNVPADMH